MRFQALFLFLPFPLFPDATEPLSGDEKLVAVRRQPETHLTASLKAMFCDHRAPSEAASGVLGDAVVVCLWLFNVQNKQTKIKPNFESTSK